MAAIAGYGGKVMQGTNVVAEIGNWSLEISVDDLETTSLGDAWARMITGLKSWSGSLEGNWDMTDTNGQKALQDAMLGGTSVTLKLYTNATNNYSGTAYITKISMGTKVDDKVNVSFDFKGSGALTYA